MKAAAHSRGFILEGPRVKNPWTPAQLAALRACCQQKTATRKIDWPRAAQDTGHPVASCKHKASTLGLTEQTPAAGRKRILIRSVNLERRDRAHPRPCLCCQREFRSEGAHNRLCDTCRRIDASPFEL